MNSIKKSYPAETQLKYLNVYQRTDRQKAVRNNVHSALE